MPKPNGVSTTKYNALKSLCKDNSLQDVLSILADAYEDINAESTSEHEKDKTRRYLKQVEHYHMNYLDW